MTDRDSCSRVALGGRRIVVDLSDGDLTRLAAIGTRRGQDGAELVLEWIRRGLLVDGAWAESGSRPGRVARDVDIGERSDELFRGLLGEHDHSD